MEVKQGSGLFNCVMPWIVRLDNDINLKEIHAWLIMNIGVGEKVVWMADRVPYQKSKWQWDEHEYDGNKYTRQLYFRTEDDANLFAIWYSMRENG